MDRELKDVENKVFTSFDKNYARLDNGKQIHFTPVKDKNTNKIKFVLKDINLQYCKFK